MLNLKALTNQPNPAMAATTRLTPYDQDLVEHYTRAVQVPEMILIDVKQGGVRKSGNPEPDWRTVRRLPASVSEEEVAAARRAVLRFGKFFPICGKCGKRTPTALMGQGRVCQPCGGLSN